MWFYIEIPVTRSSMLASSSAAEWLLGRMSLTYSY